jgi:hypothetical protein
MSAEMTPLQLAKELGRQHDRIRELERALANLAQRQDESDDRLVSLELVVGPTTGPSFN